MSVTELSTLIASMTALLAGVGLPLYASYRKGRGVTTSSVMQLIVQERDRLQTRLDAVEANYTRQLAALKVEHVQAMATAEAEWRKLHEKDQAQIAQLHTEIDSLYRRFYQQPPASHDPFTR